MSNLSVFNFQEKSVRTTIHNTTDVWFCLNDVLPILGLQNRAISKFQFDTKGVEKLAIPSNGGEQETAFINEPNLYRVIFRSNKPEAIHFQNWVFNEVLPTIRKTGSYKITISPEQQSALQEVVARRSQGSKNARVEMWARHNRHFKIAKYSQLLAVNFEDALSYLEKMDVKAKLNLGESELQSLLSGTSLDVMRHVGSLYDQIYSLSGEKPSWEFDEENLVKAFVGQFLKNQTLEVRFTDKGMKIDVADPSIMKFRPSELAKFVSLNPAITKTILLELIDVAAKRLSTI